MIIRTFTGSGRSANVCLQEHTHVVMCYENENYIKTIEVMNEKTGDELAQSWIDYDTI
jgi:hypothetical protein